MRQKSQETAHFWSGNEACAHAAIAAGCYFFAGYPITPSSEIAEHLSRLLPPAGGTIIQMEDELASIGATVGASWAGTKAMTATSGPGFSLMQETIGYAYFTETPIVIVDVQRLGPSTGQATKCAQGDVMQARWGTHGDYQAIALSPNSVQEMYEQTIRAFNLAERYRTPVILLADETVAHMREPIIPPETVQIVNRRKPEADEKAYFGLQEIPPMPSVGEGYNIAVTGSTHNEYGIRYTADPEVHRRLVQRLNDKIQNHTEQIAEAETRNLTDCSIGIIAYGCTSRSLDETVDAAEAQGKTVGYVRPKTLWPLPQKQIQQLAKVARKIVVPEMNLRQLYYEIQRIAGCESEILPLNKIGGGELITPEEILTKITEVTTR